LLGRGKARRKSFFAKSEEAEALDRAFAYAASRLLSRSYQNSIQVTHRLRKGRKREEKRNEVVLGRSRLVAPSEGNGGTL